ncbi:MAG TPA: lactate utilization protein [Bryobacteraceae bacterium]|nr:lactate utilization protein [Bryobacteraceae bacterium]
MSTSSNARDAILGRIRQSLKRTSGDSIAAVPAARLRATDTTLPERIAQFSTALATLSGVTYPAADETSARDYIDSVVSGRSVVVADSPMVRRCGLAYAQAAVSEAAVGITGAEYALADTGSLVVMSAAEPRLYSLLPPVHIAVVESGRILSGLDEFLAVVPRPADLGASTVFITGPSRTADIEQILVRGVHGPGELHVVILP